MRFLGVARFTSCSKDNLPFVLHALRALMHQFYPSNTLLAPHSTCVRNASSRALAPKLFCGLFTCIMCFMGFFHFDSDHFRRFLFVDLTSCNSKLKFSSCYTLSLWGMSKIYKAQVQYLVCKLSKLLILKF